MDCIAYQAPLSIGIFQAKVLEWVAISCSRGSSRPRDQTWVFSIADRCFTIWATREAQQRTYLLCLFPNQGSNPGIETGSSAMEADALTSELPGRIRPILCPNCKESWGKWVSGIFNFYSKRQSLPARKTSSPRVLCSVLPTEFLNKTTLWLLSGKREHTGLVSTLCELI